MMRGVLADHNVEGILEALGYIWFSDTWREIFVQLNLSIEYFDSVGLSPDSADSVVWKTCQEERLVLITANRNADGPESLEAVIRNETQPDSLPVFTLADPQRILQDRVYAIKTAERLLEYLFEIELHLGAGRIYVP
jgi:hypothetical protein